MATIKRFEEIRAWQIAREMVKLVYKVSAISEFAKDFGLRDQIRRSAGSVMHNIAEGFNSGSDNEFIRFLGYARRSASECQSQLYIALDQNYISQEQFQSIFDKAEVGNRQINGLIGYLHRSRSKNKLSEPEIPYQLNIDENSYDQSDK